MNCRAIHLIAAPALLALVACAGNGERAEARPDGPAAGTRPSGQPNEIVLEGRIEQGVECPILRTRGGEVYALSLGEADFGPGDYVRVIGEIADASFCMQGRGTLIPLRIIAIEPPATGAR